MNAEQCVQGKGDLILLMLRVGLLIVVEDMTFDALLLPLTVGCYNHYNRNNTVVYAPTSGGACKPSSLY